MGDVLLDDEVDDRQSGIKFIVNDYRTPFIETTQRKTTLQQRCHEQHLCDHDRRDRSELTASAPVWTNDVHAQMGWKGRWCDDDVGHNELEYSLVEDYDETRWDLTDWTTSCLWSRKHRHERTFHQNGLCLEIRDCSKTMSSEESTSWRAGNSR